MKKDRMNGILIGIFYFVAAVSAVIAVLLYQPLLSEDWYKAAVNGSETAVLVGVMNDILLIVTAVGTAVMLFPYVRLWNEHSALASLFPIYGSSFYSNWRSEHIRFAES